MMPKQFGHHKGCPYKHLRCLYSLRHAKIRDALHARRILAFPISDILYCYELLIINKSADIQYRYREPMIKNPPPAIQDVSVSTTWRKVVVCILITLVG